MNGGTHLFGTRSEAQDPRQSGESFHVTQHPSVLKDAFLFKLSDGDRNIPARLTLPKHSLTMLNFAAFATFNPKRTSGEYRN